MKNIFQEYHYDEERHRLEMRTVDPMKRSNNYLHGAVSDGFVNVDHIFEVHCRPICRRADGPGMHGSALGWGTDSVYVFQRRVAIVPNQFGTHPETV